MSASSQKPLLKPVYEQIICPWSPEHPRNDHQQIFPLDDKRLMLIWSEYESEADAAGREKGQSGYEDNMPCQITSMISTDAGRTWSQRRVLQPNIWARNVKQANLLRLSADEVLLFYVGWDSDTRRNIYMRRSTDNTATWSEQIQISEPGWYCNNTDRALRLSTGRVILPAHEPASNHPNASDPKKLHAFVYYSDDNFQTWHRSANTMTAPGRGAHEPTIVELKDGRLLCFVRNTNQCIYRACSEDGGLHWSTPEPTELQSPESPSLLKRIPATGDLLLLWNDVPSAGNWPRTPLTAAVSKDEGLTWIHHQDIDNRADHDAAYPAVTFVGDEVLVTYYTARTDWARDSEVMLKVFNTQQFSAT